MGYRLGVDLGTTFTAAVVSRPGSAPTVVPLGDRAAMVPSVLFLGEDGTTLMGEAAERRALTDPDRVVRRFKRRIGDETPLLVGAGGEGMTAHAIAARMIALVADRVAEQEGGAPDAIAVTVPASWGAHKKDLLATALTREGLLGVGLISEPTAAALAYAGTGRLPAGTTLAVYDFGGGTFDAALLRAANGGRFTPLGTPTGLPNLGGIDFDDAVLAYVLGTVGPQTPGVEFDDPAHVTALARLRRECVEAKEGLSADTSVTVPVMLGGVSTSVRLTRGEFEAMIAGAVEETCIAVEAALVSAGLVGSSLDRILLTGGTSRIPLVTQLLSARYPGVALERDIDPKLAVAIGGVLALDAPRSEAVAVPALARGARQAAPQPAEAGLFGTGLTTDAETALLTAAAAAAAAQKGPKPERPAIQREAFDREPGAALVKPKKKQKRVAPVVLMVVAGLIMTSSVSLSLLGKLKFDHGVPSAQLQEAKADSRENTTHLEEEALKSAKSEKAGELSATAGESAAQASDSSTASSEETSSSSSSSGSAGSSQSSGSTAASGRTEGSAVSRSNSGTYDVPTTDQASAKRAAARKAKASGAKTAGSTGTAATAPASTSTAPAAAPAAVPAAPAAPAQPAAAPAASDTDSGSIEAFNEGSTDAPPSGN